MVYYDVVPSEMCFRCLHHYFSSSTGAIFCSVVDYDISHLISDFPVGCFCFEPVYYDLG